MIIYISLILLAVVIGIFAYFTYSYKNGKSIKTTDAIFVIFLLTISVLISLGLSIFIHYYILGWG